MTRWQVCRHGETRRDFGNPGICRVSLPSSPGKPIYLSRRLPYRLMYTKTPVSLIDFFSVYLKHTCAHTEIYTDTYTMHNIHIHTPHMHSHVRTHTHTCSHIHIYTHRHINTYTYTHHIHHTYADMYTYTHAHARAHIYTFFCALISTNLAGQLEKR